ncbi:MAG: helix-turn-helix domain-containing protein [Ruminococcus sp.]|nr:helix-turn-helix domain-containing protein [Ruminococcus sp.]
MKESIVKRLAYLEFINRENNFHHHKYDEEMLQYEYIKSGDMRAIDEAKRMIHSAETGHLSDDPLKNLLYLCIANITLVTRFAIEGGMDAEKAYNASDLYIQKYDKAKTTDEIYALHGEMTEYFVKAVAAAKKENVFSKQVVQCIDYIHYHLHEQIVVGELAKMVRLNESYLSVLFKRETGMNITEYVIVKRMEAAENMLKYSDYTLNEISDILHFSSYSHFARTFRKYYNTSPKEYRNREFRQAGWDK